MDSREEEWVQSDATWVETNGKVESTEVTAIRVTEAKCAEGEVAKVEGPKHVYETNQPIVATYSEGDVPAPGASPAEDEGYRFEQAHFWQLLKDTGYESLW